MKRKDMVCTNCVKFDGSNCRADTLLIPISTQSLCIDNCLDEVEPSSYWCARGEWREPSRYGLGMVPVYWGQSEEDNLHNPLGMEVDE